MQVELRAAQTRALEVRRREARELEARNLEQSRLYLLQLARLEQNSFGDRNLNFDNIIKQIEDGTISNLQELQRAGVAQGISQ